MLYLVLTAIVLVLAAGLIVLLQEFTRLITDGLRGVLKRILPFLIAFSAGLVGFAGTAAILRDRVGDSDMIATAASLVIFVCVYFSLRRTLFSSDNRIPSRELKEPAPDKWIDTSLSGFEPLKARWTLRGKRDPSEEQRMDHIVSYMEGKSSQSMGLKSTRTAVKQVKDLNSNSFETDLLAWDAKVSLWLRETERAFEDSRNFSEGRILLHVESAAFRLEKLAVEGREIVLRMADENSERLLTRGQAFDHL